MTWRPPALCAIIAMGAAWAALAMGGVAPRPAHSEPSVMDEPVTLVPQYVDRLQKGILEVTEGLRAQPDVALVDALIQSEADHEPLNILVTVKWSTPTAPPEVRLETIAAWVRTRFESFARVSVEVRDDAGRIWKI